jgi:esterase/lipase
MYPAFYIQFFGWIGALKSNLKKARALKKKLSKERYKRIKALQSKGVSEKYPFRLTLAMNTFRFKQRKHISNIEGVNINIIWGDNDETTKNTPTQRFLRSKIDAKKNNLVFDKATESHFNALDRGQTRVFENIVDFINKQ